MVDERLSDIELDEALEILWTLEEEGEEDKESFKKRLTKRNDGDQSEHRKRFRRGYRNRITEKVISELERRGLAESSGDSVKLTEKGRRSARDIVRRHRLAERLMVDILDMGPEEVEKPACEFEHLLSEEVTERICTLLGHPKECPHGMPIPGGECCSTDKETIKPAVSTLTDVPIGEEVEIAYIHTQDHSRLHKLLSYDVGPGSRVELLQKNPVYVIKAGESEIAVEEEVLKNIFVKTLE
ncbi:MAG: metal-dependent transcriptional regulator [Candidatus Thermoplasmatota archaeon]